MDDEITGLIIENLEKSRQYMYPAGNTLDDSIMEIKDDCILTGLNIRIYSKKLSEILQKSKRITFMICTVGNEICVEIQKIIVSGSMTQAVIWDAVASESVETFADYITEVLTRENRLLGWNSTMRYSPGYGDFKTDIHEKILPLLEADKIGVTYQKDNYILLPEKSISAVIGWMK